jgi:hypothetical protein
MLAKLIGTSNNRVIMMSKGHHVLQGYDHVIGPYESMTDCLGEATRSYVVLPKGTG